MKKVTLFGCKDTTLHFARHLKSLNCDVNLISISPEKGISQKVAGFYDLRQHSDLFSDIYIAKRYDLTCEEDQKFFSESSLSDLGFVIGWQRLVPPQILDRFKNGVFGMHGSTRNLPFGKGRSPMNWSLIEDRKWFFTNLFKYSSGVDAGPIAKTDCFSINSADTSETLHYKNLTSMCKLVSESLTALLEGSIHLTPQQVGEGSFYPKRTPEDSAIDWFDSIANVERLVRAVAPPFGGAFSFINEKKISILRASVFYTDLEQHSFLHKKPGTICSIFPSGKFLIRCTGGVLIVHEFDFLGGTVSKGDIAITPEKFLKVFERNKHGYFDV